MKKTLKLSLFMILLSALAIIFLLLPWLTMIFTNHTGSNNTSGEQLHEHIAVIDEAIAPTCSSSGLTEGKHCSICNEILVKQEQIPALGHDIISHDGKAATCTEAGYSAYETCSRCDYTTYTAIPAFGHAEVIDEAVAPTETTSGITEGKHCSTCGEILVAQREIPATGTIGLAYAANEDGTTCTLKGLGTCTKNDIIIPIQNESGLVVTAIGENAFSECSNITSIIIPETIMTIGMRAFYGCTRLTSIHIPSSVTSIGTQIFYKTSNLNTVYYDSYYSDKDNPFLNIPNIKKIVFGGNWIPPYILQSCVNITEVEMLNVTSVGELAFSGCYNLEKVNIGSIEKWCSIKFPKFWPYPDCRASNPLLYAHNLYLNGSLVTDLVIPNGIKSISEYAFVGCSSLKSVTIPESLSYIGNMAFYNCTGLERINISSLEKWCSINFYHRYYDGVDNFSPTSNPLYYAHNLFLNGKLVTDLNIPDNITSIDTVFAGSSITSVSIPDSITSINTSAFLDCSNLTSITIPDTVIRIEDKAFYNCSSLTSVIIPDSVTNIGESAFEGCNSLTNIIIPNSANIHRSAFSNCRSLTHISIPDGTTGIGWETFRGCINLKSITMSRNVTYIGAYAFWYCSLRIIYYKGTADDFKKITIDSYNSSLWDATKYYYSETKPTEEGNYWHYDTDGVTPVIW